MAKSVSTDDIRIERVKKDIINIVFLDGYGKEVSTSTIDISKLKPSGMFMSSLSYLGAHMIYDCVMGSDNKTQWFEKAKNWILKEYDAYFELDDVLIPHNVQNILDKYFIFDSSFNFDDFCDGMYRCNTPDRSSECISHCLQYPNYNETVRLTFWNNGDIWIDAYEISRHYFDDLISHHYEIEQRFIDAYTKNSLRLCYGDEEDYEYDSQYRLLKSRSSMFHNLDYEQKDSSIYEAIKLLRSVESYDREDDGEYLTWKLHCKNEDGELYDVNATIGRDGSIHGIKFAADEYNVDALASKIRMNKAMRKFFFVEYYAWAKDSYGSTNYPSIYIKKE